MRKAATLARKNALQHEADLRRLKQPAKAGLVVFEAVIMIAKSVM